MKADERNEWRQLVMEANRRGLRGQIVRMVDVLPPTTATDHYVKLLETASCVDATSSW